MAETARGRLRLVLGLSLALNLLVGVALGSAYLARTALFRTLIHPAFSAARTSLFGAFPVTRESVVFLGDSITQGASWNEMFPGHEVRNRGIGGDRTDDVLLRLDQVTSGRPAKIFLLIGTNDLGTGVPHDTIVTNYRTILLRIGRETPETRIYVQSVMPRAAEYASRVEALNRELEALAAEQGHTWIDLVPALTEPDRSLRDDLSDDELHLLGPGYQLWRDLLAPFVDEPVRA